MSLNLRILLLGIILLPIAIVNAMEKEKDLLSQIKTQISLQDLRQIYINNRTTIDENSLLKLNYNLRKDTLLAQYILLCPCLIHQDRSLCIRDGLVPSIEHLSVEDARFLCEQVWPQINIPEFKRALNSWEVKDAIEKKLSYT